MVGNLEGTFGDGGKSKSDGDSSNSYSFQAPPKNAEALAWAGFDVMSLANNHSYDYFEKGLSSTRKALAANDIASTGLPGQITVREANGVKVAFVAFSPYRWNASIARHLGGKQTRTQGQGTVGRGGGPHARRSGGRRQEAHPQGRREGLRRVPRRPAGLLARDGRRRREHGPGLGPPRGARRGALQRQAHRLLARQLRRLEQLQPERRPGALRPAHGEGRQERGYPRWKVAVAQARRPGRAGDRLQAHLGRARARGCQPKTSRTRSRWTRRATSAPASRKRSHEVRAHEGQEATRSRSS